MTETMSLREAWEALVPLSEDAGANRRNLLAEGMLRAWIVAKNPSQWKQSVPQAEHTDFLDEVFVHLRARKTCSRAEHDGAVLMMLRKQVWWRLADSRRKASRRATDSLDDLNERGGVTPAEATEGDVEDPTDWRRGFDPDSAVADVLDTMTSASRSNSRVPETLGWLDELREERIARKDLIARIAAETGTLEAQARQALDTRITRTGLAVVAELKKRRRRFDLGSGPNRVPPPPPGALSPEEYDAVVRRLAPRIWDRPTWVTLLRLSEARNGRSADVARKREERKREARKREERSPKG